MVITTIKWILGNFGFFMAILAIFFTIIQCVVNKELGLFEILYHWFAFLALGLTALYAFAMHAFFPEFTAATIGWHTSPFQFEVAMANLGFGVIAVLSFWGSYGFRLATIIGNTCWLWGDAIGHIYQMVVYRDFAVGNAGSWFYMDVFLPVLLIICMIKLKPKLIQ